MKFLVLDDHPDMLAMVKTMLRSAYGPEVEIHSGRNGLEGLTLLEADSAPPDIILTNLRMPEMDGLEFMSEVRHRPTWDSARLVMMTALHTADIQQQAAAGGAHGFLPKPFNLRDLRTIIDRVLAI
jgi:CheY-like chemotaxis protein